MSTPALQEGPSLEQLALQLGAGSVTSRSLVQDCLHRIADPSGEGARAFVQVDTAAALADAHEQDRLRAQGHAPSRFAGIPVSVKDLFDVQGQVTRAGSRVLEGQPPAAQDAPAVQRLRSAGLVLIGRTQMPEFAISGLGLNDHDGTPLNPWRRDEARAPGGSTSGGAVSVADGMAHAALGTDTGGSCRIPAAWCGLVGYKPTARSVPMQGLVPLSTSLDSVGPLARSVRCCAALHALLSATPDPLHSTSTDAPLPSPGVQSLRGLRLGLPQTMVLEGLDSPVAQDYERTLAALSAHGVQLVPLPMRAFADVPAMHARGSVLAAEALAWHAPWIACHAALYDPRVLERLQRAAAMSAVDYIQLLQARQRYTLAVNAELAQVDALVLPTCAGIPPLLADLRDDASFAAANLKALRNAALVNLFDGCAITLPMHRRGDPPAGLMLASAGGGDAQLLKLAAAVELVLPA